MQLTLVKNSPVVIADNLFTSREYELMFEEFKRIKARGLLLDGDQTLGATNKEGKSLNNNMSCFLDFLYNERNLSDMLVINRKIFSQPVVSKLCELHPFYEYLKAINSDGTLLSYYDSYQNYGDHVDSALITALTWFYEQPKKFEGGDFVIEKDFVVECKANRTVFMPSYMLHAVTPVTPEKPNKGLGRYTMTQFTYITPKNM